MPHLLNREFMIERPYRSVRRCYATILETPDSLAWIIFAAVAANTLAYIVMFSNPVIRSDAWYFLDVFVRKALDGTLRLGDFFVQRGGMDHAQPLRKLILLMDLRYFDLDFRYEALAGWFAALVSLLILRRLIFWHDAPDKSFRGMRVWLWAGLCVAFVSLNSTDVWGWPLVTGSYTSYALLFATLLGLWRWLALGRAGLFMLSALAFDLAADDTAMLVNIACLLALAITIWQNPPMRTRAIKGAAMLIGCFVVVRIGYAILFTPPPGFHMALDKRLGNLSSDFLDGGWWQWAIVPLASSVSFILPLEHFTGDRARMLQLLVGIGLLLAHGWFWSRVLWKRPAMSAPAFAAIVLMLVFYALVAGIIYGRVSIFGNAYLNQPRYVLAYSFNTVALLLMCASCTWDAAAVGGAIRKPALVALIALLIAWQIPLSRLAWSVGPYIKAYQQKMASQLGEMAQDPGTRPTQCAPELVVCGYTETKRAELVRLLKQHRLNVFSPRVQRTTRLDPYPPR
ncbi:hypothetical protein [Oleiagrimonas soli]|uniref:Uncharacterized protein n=1 Tax=Oleiagrimonas soli TaxID=1543381 RepID=A0A099CY67_9GAMM|nr:hypothetical protein [Oleiagrimonas soli]KGI78507.1 hypothetical protein LF63_0103270 [Oleiagrimonas soli]MBB6184232.1 hypothetical protein [Oleiagrimonas soli]